MKDFRIIVTNNRQDYEFKIRQNLNEGYKMINSNLSIERPIQFANKYEILGKMVKNEKPTTNTYYDLIFYAYMEKEIN